MNIDIMKCKLVKDSTLNYGNVASATDAADVLRKIGIHNAAEEYAYILCLNCKGNIVGIHEISHGDITGTPVHPREVYKRALINNAVGIIFAHNHPSGVASPSPEDIVVTHKLYMAGELIGIRLKDSIIITDTDAFSFSANDLLKPEIPMETEDINFY